MSPKLYNKKDTVFLVIVCYNERKNVNEMWLGFHTLDIEMAIDNLKEIKNDFYEKAVKHLNGGASV